MKYVTYVLVVLLVIALLMYATVPGVRAMFNRHGAAVQKADDSSRYETVKKVEDTCRAMIASYTADAMTYSQYNGSDSGEKQGWADQAKMRANKTAAEYNAYVLKNSFVFAGNVPEDIRAELGYIE